eukprot:27954_1
MHHISLLNFIALFHVITSTSIPQARFPYQFSKSANVVIMNLKLVGSGTTKRYLAANPFNSSELQYQLHESDHFTLWHCEINDNSIVRFKNQITGGYITMQYSYTPEKKHDMDMEFDGLFSSSASRAGVHLSRETFMVTTPAVARYWLTLMSNVSDLSASQFRMHQFEYFVGFESVKYPGKYLSLDNVAKLEQYSVYTDSDTSLIQKQHEILHSYPAAPLNYSRMLSDKGVQFKPDMMDQSIGRMFHHIADTNIQTEFQLEAPFNIPYNFTFDKITTIVFRNQYYGTYLCLNANATKEKKMYFSDFYLSKSAINMDCHWRVQYGHHRALKLYHCKSERVLPVKISRFPAFVTFSITVNMHMLTANDEGNLISSNIQGYKSRWDVYQSIYSDAQVQTVSVKYADMAANTVTVRSVDVGTEMDAVIEGGGNICVKLIVLILIFGALILVLVMLVIGIIYWGDRKQATKEINPASIDVQIAANKTEVMDRQNSVYLCVICMDNEPNMFNFPCGHNCYCSECATQAFEQNKTCPSCRKNIGCLRKIYKAGMKDQ